jgi:hypothetical protein
MFVIMGCYNGRTEEIDTADTEREAHFLLCEYRMAYGPGWQLWILAR